MNHKGHVPVTPVVNKQTRFDALIGRLCEFVAVADRAHIKLRQQRRVNPQQDFKLITEISFARSIVMHMAGVSQAEYQTIITKIQQHPDFDKSADAFCDDFAPPKNKLVTLEEFNREQIMAKARGDVAPRGIRG